MNRDQARELYASLLLDRIREDRFPSSTHMTLLEQELALMPQLIPEYLQILVQKITSTNHPSHDHLRRFAMMAEAVPR